MNAQTTKQEPSKTNTSAPAASTPATTADAPEIKAVPADATLASVIVAVNKLVEKANKKRDRGPDSERNMTEEDARRIQLGDLKDASHTNAAKTLGLSYGQVYSARFGHTFKAVFKEAEALKTKSKTH